MIDAAFAFAPPTSAPLRAFACAHVALLAAAASVTELANLACPALQRAARAVAAAPVPAALLPANAASWPLALAQAAPLAAWLRTMMAVAFAFAPLHLAIAA